MLTTASHRPSAQSRMKYRKLLGIGEHLDGFFPKSKVKCEWCSCFGGMVLYCLTIVWGDTVIAKDIFWLFCFIGG